MERHHREPLAHWQLALGPPAQDRRRRSRGRCEASRLPTLNRLKYTSESRKLLRSDNASAKIGFVTAKDELSNVGKSQLLTSTRIAEFH